MKDNPTPQEAADFFAETPQHKMVRLRGHIKILEEALSMKRAENDALKEKLAILIPVMIQNDMGMGSIIWWLENCEPDYSVLDTLEDALIETG